MSSLFVFGQRMCGGRTDVFPELMVCQLVPTIFYVENQLF